MEDSPAGNPTAGTDTHSTTEIGSPAAPQSSRSRANLLAEEAVLAQLRRGRRQDALKLLMTAYSPHIIAFAVRLLRNREAAKDVHQQVFLEAFQGFDRFEGRSTLWRWLCTITHHRCIDELRRGRRTPVAGDFDLWDELAAPHDPRMDDDRVASQRALEKCLGKLSSGLRTQVLMRYFLELGFSEIGENVGASHGTVQMRVSRILPRLRQCLREEGVAR